MDENTNNPNVNPNVPPQTPPGGQVPPESTFGADVPPVQPAGADFGAGQVLESNPQARMWAMFCHLAALAGFTGIPFANVLGPLIVWLIKKEEFKFVDDQGKESLNFQISVAIYILASSVLICLAGLGFVLMGAIALAALVFVIIAAIEANKGKVYRYPLTIRLIK